MPSLTTKHPTFGFLVALCASACGGGVSGPQPTFAVTDGAQAPAAVPWPSDLLRDADGHVAISTLPLDDTVLKPLLLDDLNTQQDGFGLTSGAYFAMGRYQTTSFGSVMPDADVGAVDKTTLDGNVHLLPLACADGTMPDQAELPVFTYLRSTDLPQHIYARPLQGVVLRERCTYAYVITNKVMTDQGALVASDDMRALLDDGTPDGRLTKAHATYAPLRARLASGAIGKDDVAVATVFTTHSVTPDYLAARAILTAHDAPKAKVTYVFARTKTADDDGTLDDLFGVATTEQPGNDNPGGVAHANIEFIVQGSYNAPDYLGGATLNAIGVESTAQGVLEHDGSMPRVKGMLSVPFSIVIPVGADLAALEFAVIQHGLGSERKSLLTVANTLAGKGIASILIDLPFHGSRNKDVVDAIHNFTMAAGPDGFGESTQDASFGFFDVSGNGAAGIPGVLPRAIRSAFFQSVSDIQQAFRLMSAGDLSAIGTREPRLATLKIDASHEVYVGESFGSMIGTIVAAFESRLDGAVLDVDGGGLILPLLLGSPVYGPIFGTLLDANLGTHGGESEEQKDTDWGYNLAQYLLEGGDSVVFAPYVRDAQSWGAASSETDHACNVLQLSAFHDESVPNPANLAIARAMGLTPLALSDGSAPDLGGWPGAPMANGVLSANAGTVTAAFVQFHEASHVMMTTRNAAHNYDFASATTGFPKLATPVPIMNPIDRVNAIVGSFADSVLKGQAPTVQ
jgi:hypothetical protein